MCLHYLLDVHLHKHLSTMIVEMGVTVELEDLSAREQACLKIETVNFTFFATETYSQIAYNVQLVLISQHNH